jgi:hypothetical protein
MFEFNYRDRDFSFLSDLFAHLQIQVTHYFLDQYTFDKMCAFTVIENTTKRQITWVHHFLRFHLW